MQTGDLFNQKQTQPARKWPTTPYIHDHLCTWSNLNRPKGGIPIQSSQGHKYIAICYVADCKATLSKPIKNRTTPELLQACQKFYNILVKAGQEPKLNKQDNETSTEVKDFIRSKKATIQYVPSDNHHTNAAKWAIQTWKNRFKAGLATLPKDFPLTSVQL